MKIRLTINNLEFHTDSLEQYLSNLPSSLSGDKTFRECLDILQTNGSFTEDFECSDDSRAMSILHTYTGYDFQFVDLDNNLILRERLNGSTIITPASPSPYVPPAPPRDWKENPINFETETDADLLTSFIDHITGEYGTLDSLLKVKAKVGDLAIGLIPSNSDCRDLMKKATSFDEALLIGRKYVSSGDNRSNYVKEFFGTVTCINLSSMDIAGHGVRFWKIIDRETYEEVKPDVSKAELRLEEIKSLCKLNNFTGLDADFESIKGNN